MKRNAALVVAFLCLVAFFMPWDMVVPDPFYVHVVSIAASTLIVIVAAILSRAQWSLVVQIVESVCVVWQSKVVLNWDNPNDIFYLVHDDFMLCAFVIEMLFLVPQTPIYARLKDAISNTLRRAFLALVLVYPNNSGLHD